MTCRDNAKKQDVRMSNIEAAKALADAVRTSLGPRGMDKMVGCAFKRTSQKEDCTAAQVTRCRCPNLMER